MFTPGQVSDMLDIPPSTLRRYVKDYGKHLSKDATKKRGRRFSEQDITTLSKARNLLQQGRNPKEVSDLLSVVGDDPKQENTDSALSLVPSISQALTEIQDEARSIKATIEDISEHQSESDTRLIQLEEWMMKRQEWENQPRYKRIFGKPPD